MYRVEKKFVFFDWKNLYFFTNVYDVFIDDKMVLRTLSEELAYACNRKDFKL